MSCRRRRRRGSPCPALPTCSECCSYVRACACQLLLLSATYTRLVDWNLVKRVWREDPSTAADGALQPSQRHGGKSSPTGDDLVRLAATYASMAGVASPFNARALSLSVMPSPMLVHALSRTAVQSDTSDQARGKLSTTPCEAPVDDAGGSVAAAVQQEADNARVAAAAAVEAEQRDAAFHCRARATPLATLLQALRRHAQR